MNNEEATVLSEIHDVLKEIRDELKKDKGARDVIGQNPPSLEFETKRMQVIKSNPLPYIYLQKGQAGYSPWWKIW